MSRRVLAAAVVAALVIAAVPVASAHASLPPCCKAHGCTMMKRAAHGSAFSRCDGTGSATDLARQVIAVLALECGLTHRTAFAPLHAETAAASRLETAKTIDHPPELHFV